MAWLTGADAPRSSPLMMVSIFSLGQTFKLANLHHIRTLAEPVNGLELRIVVGRKPPGPLFWTANVRHNISGTANAMGKKDPGSYSTTHLQSSAAGSEDNDAGPEEGSADTQLSCQF